MSVASPLHQSHGVGEGGPAGPCSLLLMSHGEGEGDSAADYQVHTTPHHGERIDQGKSTPQGGREVGGIWFSDTRHLDPRVPGGEGGYWLCDTSHLDPKVTGREKQREGVAVHTTGEGERWEGSGLAIPDTWTRWYQEGRGGTGFVIPGTWTRR